MNFTVIIKENELSIEQVRVSVPSAHAHNLGLKGGFYKVQLINAFGVIEFEYRG